MSWHDRHKLVPAVYVLLERDGKIVMIRRANTGYQDGKYTLPAGHLDGNEAPSAAAIREAQEEVGVVIAPEDLQYVVTLVYKALEGDHERVSFFFKAERFRGEPKNKEPEKADDLQWFDIGTDSDEIIWELRAALREMKAGHNYAELNY